MAELAALRLTIGRFVEGHIAEEDEQSGGMSIVDGGASSMTTAVDAKGHERVALHAGHAARASPRRPYVYVYDVPEHTSLILQYRAQAYMCTHRVFSEANQTKFPAVRRSIDWLVGWLVD